MKDRKANNGFMVRGCRVPDESVGQFRDRSAESARQWRQYLADSGYVFLRGVLDKDEVLTAREEVFSRLVEVGEIKPPAIEGIATGRSRRREIVEDLIGFWRSVSEGPALRRVSHGPRVRSIMQKIFDEPARPQDYLWLRPRALGWSTGLHFDHPFFARGSPQVHTVWIPLGDIPLSDGPLTLVEGSHKFLDLIRSVHAKDNQANKSPTVAEQTAFQGEWSADAIAFLRKRKARLLSAEFCAGDVLVFTLDTLHGSLDNDSQIGRTRLSCDVRYQPWSDPLDERYFGPNPSGASGRGYGDMNSCKPLTE
jgi:ectoine hydroxylase-related dioxygenase (phytanoyl-CoA dioxygenase family)